jgi:hypothetical protein
MKITGTANGSFTFSRMVADRPDIELPVNGAVVTPLNGKILCKALSVKGASSYTFNFTHESGETFSVTSDEPQKNIPASKLRAGVWQVSCTPAGGHAGSVSCFAIKQPRPTTPVYIFGYKPVIDGKVTEFDQISVQVLRPAEEIDLTKTTFTVNGKKVKHFEDDPAEVGSKSKTPKVKVKLNSGWKLKSICYNHGEGTKSKKIKNGGKMKLKGTFENYLVIKAKKGSTTAKVEICVYKD